MSVSIEHVCGLGSGNMKEEQLKKVVPYDLKNVTSESKMNEGFI